MRASPPLLLLLGTCLLALAVSCHGHAFLLSPLSRARVLGQNEYTASAGNGLGSWPYRSVIDQADVCGDPHQDAGDLNLRGSVTSFQATYSPGAVITVTFRAWVNHGGWFGVRLCPDTRSNPSQACFDRHVLVNADTGYQRWWITNGRFGIQNDYTTRWRLPAGVSCDGGCVLQMTYRTANSCVDPCSSAECGPSYAARNNPVTGQTRLDSCGPARTEVFRDCADVRITGSGGGGSGGGGSGGGGGSSPTTGTIAAWQQCGGRGNAGGGNCGRAGFGPCVDGAWTSPTCQTGNVCRRSNEWWWQCEPASQTTGGGGGGGGTTPSAGTIGAWQQCGGRGNAGGGNCGRAGFGPCVDGAWTSPTCRAGHVCRRSSEWWWQCEPANGH